LLPRTVNVKTAEETISGQGVMVYLMEELTDARLRCEQLKHYVAEASKLVSASPHKDHFWEVAGHLMHGIPETLFKLDKALSATALAAGKLDYEGLKQNLRPEKADELERVLEDARIHYVKRRSGDGTMIRPKQAAEALRRMADDIDTSGGFPLGPMVQLLAALEGKEAIGPASKMASIPVHGLCVPAGWLRTLADGFTPGPDKHPSRDMLAGSLRRLVAGVMSSDMLALLQSAGSREEVEKGFKKENPALTDAQLKEIGDQWEKNKDVVKDKTASDVDKTAMDLEEVQALKTQLMAELDTKLSADLTAADMSPALTAFAIAFDTARAAWKAAQRGNERLTAMQGLGTIVNMAGALAVIAPESANDLNRISAMAIRMVPHLKAEAAKGDVLASKEAAFDPISDYNSSMVYLALKLRDAENEIEDASSHAWKAIEAVQGGGTKKAMNVLIPAVLDIVRDCRREQEQIKKIRGFALMDVPKVAAEGNKDSKYTKGEPADPTENMTEEQAAEWKAQNEAHKDQFKSADWKA
jgi:hypothetical protein